MILKTGAPPPSPPATEARVPQPFVKWAGGKGQLLDRLGPLVPRGARYIEPFVGGGALFFHVQPERAVLADANVHLMTTWQAVRDDVDTLIQLLRELREKHGEAFYYEVRERFNHASLSPLERAAAFIYLNKTGFNGLYRENGRGYHNVPFGRYRNPSIFNELALRASSRALQGADLRCHDFTVTTAVAEAGDFVYFDPPYNPVSKTSNFTSYTQNTFGEAQQAQLAEVYRALDAKGCRVVLSNSDTPLIRKLYRGFRLQKVRAVRAINCVGGGRGEVDEVLIRNFTLRG